MKMKMKMKNWKHCSELRTGHYQPDTELLQQRLHGSCKMEEEEEEEEEEVVVLVGHPVRPQSRPDQPGGAATSREWPAASSKPPPASSGWPALGSSPGHTVVSHLFSILSTLSPPPSPPAAAAAAAHFTPINSQCRASFI